MKKMNAIFMQLPVEADKLRRCLEILAKNWKMMKIVMDGFVC